MKKIYILTETFDFQGTPTTTIVGVSMNASTAQRMLQNEIDDNMQIQSSRRYQEGNGHFVDEYISFGWYLYCTTKRVPYRV